MFFHILQFTEFFQRKKILELIEGNKNSPGRENIEISIKRNTTRHQIKKKYIHFMTMNKKFLI